MIPPCSEEEAALLAGVAERLREERYAVDVEDFPARPPEPLLAAYAFLSSVAGLLVYPAPLFAALLGIAAIVMHARDSEGRPLLRYDACTGANVVARAPSATRPALVILARAGVAPQRFGEHTMRALGLALQAGMVAIAATGAAVWVAGAESEVPRGVAAGASVAAALVAVVAVLLYRPTRGDAAGGSPGAEVLLGLAPLLREHDVWLLVAGAGGTAAFVDAHPETAGAAWLNLEPSRGSGTVAVSEEGTWRERRADRFLMGAAEEAGAEVRPYRAAPTAATPLLARRRRALTLMVDDSAAAVLLARKTSEAVLSGGR